MLSSPGCDLWRDWKSFAAELIPSSAYVIALFSAPLSIWLLSSSTVCMYRRAFRVFAASIHFAVFPPYARSNVPGPGPGPAPPRFVIAWLSSACRSLYTCACGSRTAVAVLGLFGSRFTLFDDRKSLHALVPITATDAARLRAVRLRIGSPSLASAVEDQGEHERAGLRHVEVVQAARALDRPAQVGLR